MPTSGARPLPQGRAKRGVSKDAPPIASTATFFRGLAKAGHLKMKGSQACGLRKPCRREHGAATRASRLGGLGRWTSATAERFNEFAERLLVHVGNGDIGEVRIRPARDMIAVERLDPACPAAELRVGR